MEAVEEWRGVADRLASMWWGAFIGKGFVVDFKVKAQSDLIKDADSGRSSINFSNRGKVGRLLLKFEFCFFFLF